MLLWIFSSKFLLTWRFHFLWRLLGRVTSVIFRSVADSFITFDQVKSTLSYNLKELRIIHRQEDDVCDSVETSLIRKKKTHARWRPKEYIYIPLSIYNHIYRYLYIPILNIYVYQFPSVLLFVVLVGKKNFLTFCQNVSWHFQR